jgi:serine phosphatase RsbU (regulator of sigma subunit)
MSGTHTLILPVLYLACGIVIFLLGLTLLRVGRSSPPTRAAALMLFFAGLGPLLSASGMILQRTLSEGTVLFTSMLENFEYLWEFYFPSLLLFALTFPRESDVLQRFPAIAVLLFLPYVLHVMAFMFGDRMLEQLARLPRAIAGTGKGGELALSGFDAVVGALVRALERVHRGMFALVNVVYAVLALDLLWRSQRGLPNRRLIRQMRTVGFGVAASLACYTLAKTSLMSGARLLPASTSQALLGASLVASGGTIAYAVIRQQFLGVRHLLQRALLYGALAALLGVVYVLGVRPVMQFFGQYSTVGQNAFEAGFVVLVVLAFQPVTERAEGMLERALMRGRGSVARRFKLVGDAVAAAGTYESLDQAVVRGVRDALDAGDVRLTMLEDANDPLAAALADIGEPVRRLELLRAHEPARPRRRFRRRRAHPTHDPAAGPRLDAEQLPARVDLFVPVMQERQCVAYVALGEKVYGLGYGAEEMGHLAVLSTQIGVALVNIRLLRESVERKVFEEELRIARQIQMKMLPGQPPAVRGFGLYGVAVPSRQVGGDYYDFIVVDDRWLVVVVADVSGKGIPASLLTATLQATVRTGADAQTDPVRMLARLNRLIYQNTSAAEFATAFYGVVDLDDGTLRYANAGHEFPFVVSGGRARQLEESGMVLGCVAEFDYREHAVAMPQGSALVVFTDGVTDSESRAGESYGTERLRRVLESNVGASARDLCRRVIEDVRAFGDGENQDDLTLVILTRGGE